MGDAGGCSTGGGCDGSGGCKTNDSNIGQRGGACGSNKKAKREVAPPVGAHPTCIKCKACPAQVQARQRESLCYACLSDSVFQKFKVSVGKYSMLRNGDRLLLCFSGYA